MRSCIMRLFFHLATDRGLEKRVEGSVHAYSVSRGASETSTGQRYHGFFRVRVDVNHIVAYGYRTLINLAWLPSRPLPCASIASIDLIYSMDTASSSHRS